MDLFPNVSIMRRLPIKKPQKDQKKTKKETTTTKKKKKKKKKKKRKRLGTISIGDYLLQVAT